MINLDKFIECVGRLDEEAIYRMLDQFIATGPGSKETWQVIEAYQQGMEIVGNRFEIGKYFAGDLIFAGEILTNSIAMLKGLLGVQGSGTRGVVLLGTVEGDVHDIGKNIYRGLIEIAGFKVIDIGVDQKPEAFVEAIKKWEPDVLGLSGVLTLAIDAMRRTISIVEESGLRGKLKIIIGGNVVNNDVCRFVGADAWSKNAAEAVKLLDKWF